MEKRNSLDIQVDVLVIIPTVDRSVHMHHHAIQEELNIVHMHHAFQKELQTDTVNMEQAIQEEVFSTRNYLLILLMKEAKLG